MSLTITSQESLFNEVQFPEGQPVEVAYVVKRTPFEAHVEVDDVPYDFMTGKIECELYYSKPKEEKPLSPVSAIGLAGNKTFEFVAHPVLNDARKCKIEFRINVLTTQHNNLNFKIRIRLSSDGDFVETYTKAIHSCSKLAQIRRKVEESREHGGDEYATVKAKKKRARCDDLIDKLQRIEDVQAKQTRLLQMMSRREPPTDSFDDDAFPWGQESASTMRAVKGDPFSLENSLTNFLESYGSIPSQERPAKIRRLVTTLPMPLQSLANNVGFFLSLDSISPPHQLEDGGFLPQPVRHRQPQSQAPAQHATPFFASELYDQSEGGGHLTGSFDEDMSGSSGSSYEPNL
jgi:hypothetical protein